MEDTRITINGEDYTINQVSVRYNIKVNRNRKENHKLDW